MKKNPLKVFCYKMDAMSLHADILCLGLELKSNIDLPAFEALEETYKNFDMHLSAAADMKNEDNPQKLIEYGNKLLKQYKNFKNLPEVQSESTQKIIDLGIEHVQGILKLAEQK